MAKLDEATVTWRLFLSVFTLSLLLFAIGWITHEPPDKRPLLDVVGGGFTVDHNTAEIHYDLSVREIRPLRHGMIIEADFEDRPATAIMSCASGSSAGAGDTVCVRPLSAG
ncbi:hypothetical protein [Nitratireductor rhodophyticola]|uniref:hypothetical protein n=1 Tax=Nitratireductor rhodophyticola TaxID=2854036 RepID=UPI0030086BA5